MTAAPTARDRARVRFTALTDKASEITRTLGIAALGAAWLFSGGASQADPKAALSVLTSNTALYAVATLAIAALTLDLLQYVTSAVAWGSYHWAIDQVLRNDHERLRWRGRLGWALLRLSRTVSYVERDFHSHGCILLSAAGSSLESWQERRQVLRKVVLEARVSEDPTTNPVWAALDRRVPPAVAGVSGVFFFSKTIVLVATYITLGLALIEQ